MSQKCYGNNQHGKDNTERDDNGVGSKTADFYLFFSLHGMLPYFLDLVIKKGFLRKRYFPIRKKQMQKSQFITNHLIIYNRIIRFFCQEQVWRFLSDFVQK